jgi:hypothetical protein
MLSKNAIEYTWKQIFYRLGIAYEAGCFIIGGQKIRFTYGENLPQGKDENGFSIFVQKCQENAFDEITSGQVEKLVSLKKEDFLPQGHHGFPLAEIPVLFWGEPSHKKFATITDHQLVIHADIIAAIFFMLSRYEEVFSTQSDKHGRYPFQASVYSRYNLIDLPIVDYYVLILKAWLESLTGAKFQIPPKFRFHFSHDVDYMFLSHPFNKWLDVIARDLLKSRWDFLKEDFPSSFKGFQEDLYFKDLKRLVEMARENGNTDIFYLLTSKPLFSRDGYTLDGKRNKFVLDYLIDSGASIGLHTSYASFDKAELFKIEKERLENASGIALTDARQHYLRVRTPYTWNQMQAAGLRCDESYSFSEHEGFRCGTCYEYRVFDVLQDQELDFYERPLIVMDASLRSYRKLTAQEGKESILKLARTCQSVNGTFTLLWHNACLSREWREWGAFLPELVRTLTEMSRV